MKKKCLFDRLFPLSGYVPYVFLFIVPVALSLSKGNIKQFFPFFTSPYYRHILLFSVLQAILSSIVAVIIGLPGAWIFSRFRFGNKKVKRILLSCVSVPFVLPSVLVVLGFVIIYGNNGFLNSILMKIFNLSDPPLKILYRLTAVIIAHAFCNFPLVINTVGDYIKNLSSSPEEAGRIDGLSEWRIFLRITVPRIIPSLISVFVLIFLYCYTSFSIVLILGGKPSLTTVGVEIASLAGRLKTESAATLSLISILVALIPVFLSFKKPGSDYVTDEDNSVPKLLKLNIAAKIYLVIIFIFSILPLVGIIIRSFMSSSVRGGETVFSLSGYLLLFNDFIPVINTIILAFGSSVFSVFFALAISNHLRTCRTDYTFNSLISVSMCVSSVILGFGYMVMSSYFSSVPPFILLMLSQAVLSLPLCLRILYPAYKSIPLSYSENAVICGAGSFKILLYIDMPTLRNALMTSFVFAFALSCGELASVLLIGGRDFPVLSARIYALINSYSYQGACVYATVMLVINFLIFLIK